MEAKDRIVEILKETDPIITEYIEAMYRALRMSKETNDKAISKIRELTERINSQPKEQEE